MGTLLQEMLQYTCMHQRYISTGLALLIDALAITVIAAALALIYWLVTGASGSYLVVLSNVLFLAGGAILTFGMLVEFIHLKGTKNIRKMLFIYQALRGRYAVLEAADREISGRETGTGWLLIFLGFLLIIFSFGASLDFFI